MRKLLFAALLSALILSACTGPEDSESGSGGVEDFSMEGTWTSEGDELNGPKEGYQAAEATLDVTETEGRTFVAEITYPTPEGDVTDQLVGSMTQNANLIAGSKEDGVYSFSVVDENTLDHCFMQTGDNYLTVCGRFTRDE